MHYALWTVQQQSCISNTTVFCISRIISCCRPRVPTTCNINVLLRAPRQIVRGHYFLACRPELRHNLPRTTWSTSRAPHKDIINEKIKLSKKSQIIIIYYTIYLTERITVHVQTHANDIIYIVSGTEEKLFRVIGTCGQFLARRNR